MNILRSIKQNATLKIISLIIGYGAWWALSQSHHTTMNVTIPVCLDNEPTAYTIDQPDWLNVTLAGNRTDLSSLDLNNLALHIDGTQLHEGKNHIAVSSTTLLLPETINVVHYKPTPMTLTVVVSSSSSESTAHAPART
jgi:hypothetical protein